MTTAEIIAIELQKNLGKNYAVFCNDAFQKDFTSRVQTPYGDSLDINYQAFDLYKDKVVAVVQTQPSNPYNTPYKLVSDSYTVNFWIPIDIIKRKASGELMEDTPFDFYADMERLGDIYRGKWTTVDYADGDYKFSITMTDAVPNGMLDKSGFGRRITMTMRGQFNLSDTFVGTGDSIKIALVIDGADSYFDNITDFSRGDSTDSNDIVQNNTTRNGSDVSLESNQVMFFVDDIVGDNAAMKLVEKKVHQRLSLPSPNEPDEDKRRKVHVKIQKGDIIDDYWAILSAQYTVGGSSGFGRYQISLIDEGGVNG